MVVLQGYGYAALTAIPLFILAGSASVDYLTLTEARKNTGNAVRSLSDKYELT